MKKRCAGWCEQKKICVSRC